MSQVKGTDVPKKAVPTNEDIKQVKMGKYALISMPDDFHAYYSQCGYDIPSNREWITMIVEPSFMLGEDEVRGNENFEEIIRNALNVMWGTGMSGKNIRKNVVVGKDHGDFCEVSFSVTTPADGEPQCMLTTSIGSGSTTVFMTTNELEALLNAIKAMQKHIDVAWQIELRHQEELAKLRAEAENTFFNKMKKLAMTEIPLTRSSKKK